MRVIKNFSNKLFLLFIVNLLLIPIESFADEPITKWLNSAGGLSEDLSQSIACDKNGNSYVVGYFKSSELKVGNITLSHSYSGDAHFFIAKYDSLGNVLWAKTTARDEFVYGLCVAVDTDGNVIVGGHFSGSTATFGSTVLTNSNAYMYGKMYVAKYDKDGNVLWAKTPSVSKYSCSTIGIGTDKLNNIYITGHFQDGLFTFADKSIANATPGSQDVFLYKITAAGTGVWAKMMGGTNHDVGRAITLDTDDNVYIVGTFSSSVMNAGSVLLTNSSQYETKDIFVAKFDNSGLLKWTKSAGGSDNEEGSCISVDKKGNVYIGGEFNSQSVTFGPFTYTKSGFLSSLILAKYNVDGDVVWVKTALDKSNNSSVNGVYADNNFNVYATGYYQTSNLDIGNLSLTNSSQNSKEMFIVRFDTLGVSKWGKSVVGFGEDYGKAIVGDNNGNLFVTGLFNGNYISADGLFSINSSIGNNDISVFRIFDSESKDMTSKISEKVLNHEIKYFPNPFRDFVKIKLPDEFIGAEIHVYNSLGQKINTFTSDFGNEVKLNVINLTKGMYLFKIVKDNILIDSKVLISE